MLGMPPINSCHRWQSDAYTGLQRPLLTTKSVIAYANKKSVITAVRKTSIVIDKHKKKAPALMH